jgi:8-oxo-dGTP pyrophosphatase MutT (NUDIX family)
MPKFNNKENEVVTLEDGRKIWLSRASAVVVNVWYIGADMKPYVLMGKRGKGCPDEVGKWVLVCGYLDYDESLAEGALREVFEETGVDISALRSDDDYSTIYDNLTGSGQPYMVNSTPGDDKRQNVTHYFGYIFSGGEKPELSADNSEEEEVEELKWVPYDEVDKLDVGFGHKKRIHSFYKEKVA